MACADSVYVYTCNIGDRAFNLHKQQENILCIMTTTVCTWLHFPPKKSTSYDHFLFVHNLRETFGNDTLYLEGVWKAYLHIIPQVFASSSMRSTSHINFQRLVLPEWNDSHLLCHLLWSEISSNQSDALLSNSIITPIHKSWPHHFLLQDHLDLLLLLHHLVKTGYEFFNLLKACSLSTKEIWHYVIHHF
jgi:hypothetical protein